MQAGEVALRFVNTVDLRWSTADDSLRDHAELLAWAVRERVVDEELSARLADLAARDPRQADAAFGAAVAFRECLYRVLEAVSRSADPDGADLAVVDDRLAASRPRLRAGAVPGRLVLDHEHLGPPLEALLGPVARSAVELLTGEAASRLRACPGSPGRACGWLFVDATKNGNRRYCVSGLCANRARVSRHRARRRRPAADGGDEGDPAPLTSTL
ncbi:Conserved protein containing a Zn-ribbon-like motif, possibly RNA-binding [Geodermatophilus saharensis]|uniref:Conserved protein containing a Zn-ribbon-like motif, possibly RNA-binding n=1 Tax=Geodermatophilus saharensis TaxID=1137994 RepID=A0A239BPE3_9ACTN|nr:ABATE domain-containing protein [Geodermatophilus saharensis]SNS09549.1 Conserved protein containing a Zn-ribbon-like motif, possibly RNA-binding [Geodermatophilus saharensis]